MASMLQLPIEPEACASSIRAGFRFGPKGTHSSRTIMLAELRELLAAVADCRGRADYAAAIIQENVLGKETATTVRSCGTYGPTEGQIPRTGELSPAHGPPRRGSPNIAQASLRPSW